MKNRLITLIMLCGNLIGTTFGQTQKSEQDVLVYISKREAGFDIYRNSIGGDAEQRLTKNPGMDWRPQFVSSAKEIIYNSQDTVGKFQMHKMSLKGDSKPLDMRGLPEFTISPDGKWAAYTRKKGENTRIWLAPLKKVADSTQISTQKGYQGRVVWSYQSDKFAFIADHSGTNEVYIYHLNTRLIQQVTQNQKREKYMSWSPDGAKLAVTMQEEDTQNDIYLISMQTLDIEQITNTSSIHESEISWALSGKYIAYHAQVGEKDDIFLINLNDRKVSKVTQGQGYHGEPAWGLE